MAYVINGGDKPSSRFHDFVDLCCQAYNLIRKHTHLFLNLLGLVRSSSLCDLPYYLAPSLRLPGIFSRGFLEIHVSQLCSLSPLKAGTQTARNSDA